MSDPVQDRRAMNAFTSGLRDMAAYDLAYTKRDISVLQIVLGFDQFMPHLTPEKRQEALDALAKLEAYRDERQTFIDDVNLQIAHVYKSNVTMIDAGDMGMVMRRRKAR